jgi:DNA-nicking Smr family endonuclease
MAPRKPSSGKQPDANGVWANEDERRMFEREFSDVQPWRRGANRISPVDFEASPNPVGQRRSPPRGALVNQSGHPLQVAAQVDGAVGLAFGVSNETVAALRHGQYKFEARCDLHGLHAEAAGRKLRVFVEECVRRNLRAALVICGRGLHSGPDGPVLAKVVADILAQPPTHQHILAFTPTAAELGGQGAVAVLFRRKSSSKL